MRSIRTALVAVLAALALLLASCGDDDAGVASSGDAPAPDDAEAVEAEIADLARWLGLDLER